MSTSRARGRAIFGSQFGSWRAILFGVLVLQCVNGVAQTPASSLLLLIDTSGSMGDPVGNGDSQSKITAARQAAAAAVERAARNGTVEIAVLAFEGGCSNPVPRQTGFTSDFDALQRFIAGLQPGGGTPMAEAILFANRFMQREGSPGSRDRMIVLLADGENDCGSVENALAEMQASGVIFRHETVGFGIEANSRAARDLREIAETSGGAFHTAADAAELDELLVQFIDTFSLIDMLGMFGGGTGRAAPAGTAANPPDSSGASASTSQADAAQGAQGPIASMLGQIQPAEPDKDEDNYIYCFRYHANFGRLGVTEPVEIYYTGVFLGDYGWTLGYELEFHDYLEDRGFDTGSSSYCFYERTHPDALYDLQSRIADDSRDGYAIVTTGWVPGKTGGAAAEDSLTDQSLHDFHISIPASPYDVQVCVRDHECEDGDRVRVSVNGIELISEEIVNAWMCRTVALSEGRHEIELFAVNGTGFKGEDCSHEDANTGEIRVTGEDAQTQSWRHRGGAGSSAGIEVAVR